MKREFQLFRLDTGERRARIVLPLEKGIFSLFFFFFFHTLSGRDHVCLRFYLYHTCQFDCAPFVTNGLQQYPHNEPQTSNLFFFISQRQFYVVFFFLFFHEINKHAFKLE